MFSEIRILLAVNVNFPKVEKVYCKNEPKISQPKDTLQQINPPSIKWWNPKANDVNMNKELNEISDENTRKIQQMSETERNEIITSVKKILPPEAFQRLQQMAKDQLKRKEPVKIEYEESKDKLKEDLLPSTKP